MSIKKRFRRALSFSSSATPPASTSTTKPASSPKPSPTAPDKSDFPLSNSTRGQSSSILHTRQESTSSVPTPAELEAALLSELAAEPELSVAAPTISQSDSITPTGAEVKTTCEFPARLESPSTVATRPESNSTALTEPETKSSTEVLVEPEYSAIAIALPRSTTAVPIVLETPSTAPTRPQSLHKVPSAPLHPCRQPPSRLVVSEVLETPSTAPTRPQSLHRAPSAPLHPCSPPPSRKNSLAPLIRTVSNLGRKLTFRRTKAESDAARLEKVRQAHVQRVHDWENGSRQGWSLYPVSIHDFTMLTRQERDLDAASIVGGVSPCQSIYEKERAPIHERDRFWIEDSQKMPDARVEDPGPSGLWKGKLSAIKYQRVYYYDDPPEQSGPSGQSDPSKQSDTPE